MSYRWEERTWPEIDDYLKNTSQTVIFPVGSTEQHGPTGILGIDYLTSQSIAHQVGEKLGLYVLPPLAFGMAQHHLAFPGTLSLRPSTYLLVIQDLISSLTVHGVKKIWFINGHGGNIAPLTTAFCEYLDRHQSVDLQLINWWHLPEVTEYEREVFKDQNGFHATCGEISLTQFTHPQAYTREVPKDLKPGPQKTRWPLSPEECRKLFPQGHMGGLPTLANAEYGQKIFQLAVEACAKRILTK
jgi:creatinine amidohydrolase